MLTDSNKFRALKLAFFREGLPNIANLLATLLVFIVVIYVQGWKYEIPLAYSNMKGAAPQPYPIKLFYTSNMPIILLSALIGNLYFFSQLLYKRYGSNPLIKLLGIWADDANGRSRPVWGISYIVSPPDGLTDLVARPFHALFYIAFMLVACGLFARAWIDLSGSGPADVYKQLQASPQVRERSHVAQRTRTRAAAYRLDVLSFHSSHLIVPISRLCVVVCRRWS